MVDTTKQIDLGGNDLVINTLYTGATTPGSAGTQQTAANLAFLSSASSANAGTNKAMITGTSGALTIAGATTATGAITPTGGIAVAGGGSVSARCWHTGGNPASAAADGTDATPSVTETYYAEVFVPCNATITGVATFNGSATGSGNITAYLMTLAGTQVGHTASTAVSGTDTYQTIAFTTPYAAIGPQTYYVATQYNNTSTRFNTHVVGRFGTGKDTGTTYGTFPTTPTVPGTFTTGLGPIASLY